MPSPRVLRGGTQKKNKEKQSITKIQARRRPPLWGNKTYHPEPVAGIKKAIPGLSKALSNNSL